MDHAHLPMATIVTIMTILATADTSAAPPMGRLLKVPKVYNALITSDIPLLPSRAETAATAAIGPVLLYSTNLPVILQPQAQGATPQNHLDKLTQLQREDLDQQRHIQLPRCCIPQAVIPVVAQPQNLPLQQQLFSELPVKPLFEDRPPIQQPYPVKQLPVQQLFPERQQPSGSKPILGSQQIPRQQYDIPYQKPHRPALQQIDVQLQLQRQKLLQLRQFDSQQKEQQDSSYLPMPEISSYQPPPLVHIDDIKNNKPSNIAIPDVPPPPLPVGKQVKVQSYSYNSPGLSPPSPTNHHFPYG